MVWLDSYERKTRLAPGLLAVLPIAVVIVSLGFRNQPVVAFIAGVLSTAGFPVLLASTVRQWGLKVQERLFTGEHALPTTEYLRHRGDPSTTQRRAQWRANVTNAVGHALPTPADEARDPAAADDRYNSAIAEIRQLTTDQKKFRLVFEENRNYGFERNLLGTRPAGVAISAASTVALAIARLVSSTTHLSDTSVTIGLLVCGAMLAIWIWRPSDSAVRRVAARYAERLLDTSRSI